MTSTTHTDCIDVEFTEMTERTERTEAPHAEAYQQAQAILEAQAVLEAHKPAQRRVLILFGSLVLLLVTQVVCSHLGHPW